MTAADRRLPELPSRADMLTRLRATLLGSTPDGPRQGLLLVALGLYGLTFLAYELDVFYHSGGIVFVPFHAALVGVVAAFWAGYSRIGLLAGWLFTSLTFLGWRTEWATDISPRPLVERVAYVVRPDGLVVLAVLGAGVAVVGFTAGASVRAGFDALRT